MLACAPAQTSEASPLSTVTGFTQSDSGELTIDIAGTGASDFGRATVTGAATLGGTLNIVLKNGFVPNVGDTFQIMTVGSTSSSFATVNGTAIGGGKSFAVTIGATSVTLEVTSP